jgi:hypothetical protein
MARMPNLRVAWGSLWVPPADARKADPTAALNVQSMLMTPGQPVCSCMDYGSFTGNGFRPNVCTTRES